MGCAAFLLIMCRFLVDWGRLPGEGRVPLEWRLAHPYTTASIRPPFSRHQAKRSSWRKLAQQGFLTNSTPHNVLLPVHHFPKPRPRPATQSGSTPLTRSPFRLKGLK